MSKLWNTINEGGEGYRPVAKHTRSAAEISSDLGDAKKKLAAAQTDLRYNPDDDSAAYRVKSLPAKIAKLEAELAGV